MDIPSSLYSFPISWTTRCIRLQRNPQCFYPLNICKGYNAVSTSSNGVNDPMNKPQQLPKDKILNETTTLIQPSFPPPSIPYKTTNKNLCPFSHSLLRSRLPDAGLPMYIIFHSSYPPISNLYSSHSLPTPFLQSSLDFLEFLQNEGSVSALSLFFVIYS